MNALQIASNDSVAVAVQEILAGERVVLNEGETAVLAREKIPFGHKVALIPIRPGDDVIKYDHPIGRAVKTIEPGDHVHTHNLVSVRGAASK